MMSKEYTIAILCAASNFDIIADGAMITPIELRSVLHETRVWLPSKFVC